METAGLLVLAAHITPEEAYAAVSGGARAAMGLPSGTIEPGEPAELVAMPASSLREAIAFGPGDRIVVHRGAVVSTPADRQPAVM
jgi:cytosine deaminase